MREYEAQVLDETGRVVEVQSVGRDITARKRLEEDLKDRLGNLMEWYAAFSFSLFFFALAWLWRSARFGVQLVSGNRS